MGCIVVEGSTVLGSDHLLVSSHASLDRACQSLVDTVLLYFSVGYLLRLMDQVHVGALVYVRCWRDAVRSCVVASDQVHVSALVYVLCPHFVTRFFVAVLVQVRAEVPAVDQNAEESPSPAWAVGKVVVPYWPDP